MNNKTSEKWLVDLKNFTCYNTENQIVISFEKKGNSFQGKIKEIPLVLLDTWTQNSDINKLFRKAFIEADEAFFKAYFANEIEKKNGKGELTA